MSSMSSFMPNGGGSGASINNALPSASAQQPVSDNNENNTGN